MIYADQPITNGVHGHTNLDPVSDYLLCACVLRRHNALLLLRQLVVFCPAGRKQNLIHNQCQYMSDPMVCTQRNVCLPPRRNGCLVLRFYYLMFGFMMRTNSASSSSHNNDQPFFSKTSNVLDSVTSTICYYIFSLSQTVARSAH